MMFLPKSFSIFIVIVLLFVGGFFPSCTTKNIKTEQRSYLQKDLKIQDYFPLRIGDTRVYRIRYKQGRVIRREIKIIGKKGDTFIDNTNPPQRYKIDAYGLRGGNKRYLLKYPLRVGTRWLSVTSITRVERYQIISIRRLVTVPAGIYKNCIVVRSRERQSSGEILENNMYFARDVGIVKVATIFESHGKRIPQWTLELISFQQTQKASPKMTKKSIPSKGK